MTLPPPPPDLYHWEDFPPGTEARFGPIAVTREAVLDFASKFDPQPFHVDDAAAAQSLFGALCASGWHTAAMAMRLICDGYMLHSASLGSPGVDAVRWLAPVFPGDALVLDWRVVEARPMNSRPHVGLVKSHWTVLNQHGKAVMTMEGWGMFRRRHPPPANP